MIEKLNNYFNINNNNNNNKMNNNSINNNCTTTLMYTPSDYDVPLRQITKKIYAKAIYDNIAESPDELAFKKGDILNVIEQDTDGLEGWWLCTLRGRQGICPGNRLRIINSYDSGCFSPSPSSSPCTSLGASTATLNSSILSSSDTYENITPSFSSSSSTTTEASTKTTSMMMLQKQFEQRRSWHTTTLHKVITPQKCGDVYSYDILPPRNYSPYQNLSIMSDPEAYDIPKPATPINYDCPKTWNATKQSQTHQNLQHIQSQQQNQQTTVSRNDIINNDDSYDIPRPVNLLHQQDITPSSSNSSLLTPSDSLSLSSSNRSSLANMPDYDIPRRNPPSIRSSIINQHFGTTYDFPNQQLQHNQQQIQDKVNLIPTVSKQLPLELSSALETLAKLQTEATTAITKLLAFVTPNWRTKDKLEPVLMDIKLVVVRLRTALHDLAEFGEGALGNATMADDKNLALKLRPLVKALRDSDKLVHEASRNIDKQGWTLENLLRLENNNNSNGKISLSSIISHPPDSLDQLIACAQTLTEDVRQSASFIQGNATLLFKRIPVNTTTTTNTNNNNNNYNYNYNNNTTVVTPTSNNNEWLEDCDYVSIDKKNSSKDSSIKSSTTPTLSPSTPNTNNERLSENDKLVITYYTAQIIKNIRRLTEAIDSFLETVERNQPPKFFIAYGKFVVLSAHNLVSIGDIVHRNITKNDLKSRIQQYTDALSDALKSCVEKSKKAAQNFPSVTAVQEMVDSVVDISYLARDLKVSMIRAIHS